MIQKMLYFVSHFGLVLTLARVVGNRWVWKRTGLVDERPSPAHSDPNRAEQTRSITPTWLPTVTAAHELWTPGELTPVFAGQEVISEETSVQVREEIRTHRHKGAVFGSDVITARARSGGHQQPASAFSYLIAVRPTDRTWKQPE